MFYQVSSSSDYINHNKNNYIQNLANPRGFLISKNKIHPTNQKYFYICFKNNKKQNDDI